MGTGHSKGLDSRETKGSFLANNYNPLIGGTRPRSQGSVGQDDENVEPGIDDRELLRSLKVSIHEHPTLDASRVSIEVSHGEVILAGQVDSHETKAEIEKLASNTPSVLRVTNKMSVEQSGQRAQGA